MSTILNTGFSSINQKIKLFDLFISLVTWIFVFLITLHLWEVDYPETEYRLEFSLRHIVVVSCLFIGHLTFSLFRIYSLSHVKLFSLLEALTLTVLLFLFPDGIVIVLGIMLVAHLRENTQDLPCLFLGIALPFLYFFQVPGEDDWFNSILFSLLNTFAIFAFNRIMAEKKAKEENAKLLRELNATQILLSASTKQDERRRIARDLHDTMGHHLTALSLQLEIASLLEGDTVQVHVNKAQSIARNLLDSVREAVSDIRQNSTVGFRAALDALVREISHVDIQVAIEPGLTISNPAIAEALIRISQEAITNVLKHSNATQCCIRLERHGEELRLSIEDNGQPNDSVQPGNGLIGMAERVEALGGTLAYEPLPHGFFLSASILESQ